MQKQLKKLCIIAGKGELPRRIIRECHDKQRDVFVISFEGITDKETTENVEHQSLHIGKVGKIIKTLRENGIEEVTLAGGVGRPPLSSLSMDFTALKLITKLAKLPSHGDDKVFSAIIKFLEERNFMVVGADEILNELLIQEGPLGSIKPDKQAERDIKIGVNAALKIGELDIGQAVVIQQGQILGVEGAEGTDKLVERCHELHNEGPGGVLVKVKKPEQDSRVDLPSIGIYTIENAYKSGLRGIAIEASASLVINRKQVIKKANELGVFVTGIIPR